MTKLFNVKVITAQGATASNSGVQAGAGAKGSPLRLKVAEGVVELQEVSINAGPKGLRTMRQGKNLLIALDGGDMAKPDIVLEDFYETAAGCRLVGANSNGVMSEYIAASGQASDSLNGLATGTESVQTLSTTACAMPVAAAAGAAAGTGLAGMNPWLLGAVGLGVVGLAASAGGSDSGSTPAPAAATTPTTGATPPAGVGIAAASDFGAKGDNRTNDTTPTITGTGTPGQTIVVTGPNNLTLTTTVAADGTWSVTPTTALPEGTANFSVVSRDAAGTSSAPVALAVLIDSMMPVVTNPNTTGNVNAARVDVALTATDADPATTFVVSAIPTPVQGVLYLADGVTPVAVGATLTTAQANGLVFVPAANFVGDTGVSFVARDRTGNETAQSTEIISIVTPNGAPTVASSPLTMGESTTVALNGRGYSISDADAESTVMQLTIASDDTDNVINVDPGNSGVVVASGNDTNSVVLRGTRDQLNTLLASDGGAAGSVSYADVLNPTSDAQGASNHVITLTVNDRVGGGAGEASSATSTIAVTVTASDGSFFGTAAADVVNLGLGNDRINGGGGDDIVRGGSGDDTLLGGDAYVRNASFEHWTEIGTFAGGPYPSYFGVPSLQDWTILEAATNELNSYGDIGAIQTIASAANSQDGRFAGDVAQRGLSQSVFTQTNTAYVLQFELTDQSDQGSTGNVFVTIDGTVVATITSGGVMTLSGSATGGSVSGIVDATGPGQSRYGNDRTYQFIFTSDADNNSSITFSSDLPRSSGRAIDDIRLAPLLPDGNDTLIAGDGNDKLWGMAGNNTLTGGAGADRFYSSRMLSANDTVTDFEVGVDKLVLCDMVDLNSSATENPFTVENSRTLVTLEDLISLGSTDQAITWNDTTKTLNFGWGGSMTFAGMTASYADANAFLTANGIVQIESFGSGA
jgi:hypothetical protein